MESFHVSLLTFNFQLSTNFVLHLNWFWVSHNHKKIQTKMTKVASATKKVTSATNKVLKSFFKKFLTFFSKEDSKKGEGKKRISYAKMEEFCREGEYFYDSITKDILNPKSEYFYVVGKTRRFVIQKTGDKEEILASASRNLTKPKIRKQPQKKKSLLNL